MNNLKSLFLLILFLVVNTSYSLQDSVVVIVNDRVILQSDLDEKMKEGVGKYAHSHWAAIIG